MLAIEAPISHASTNVSTRPIIISHKGIVVRRIAVTSSPWSREAHDETVFLSCFENDRRDFGLTERHEGFEAALAAHEVVT